VLSSRTVAPLDRVARPVLEHHAARALNVAPVAAPAARPGGDRLRAGDPSLLLRRRFPPTLSSGEPAARGEHRRAVRGSPVPGTQRCFRAPALAVRRRPARLLRRDARHPPRERVAPLRRHPRVHGERAAGLRRRGPVGDGAGARWRARLVLGARRCARRHGAPSLPARPRPSRTRWTWAGAGQGRAVVPASPRCGHLLGYGDRRGARRSRGRVDRPARDARCEARSRGAGRAVDRGASSLPRRSLALDASLWGPNGDRVRPRPVAPAARARRDAARARRPWHRVAAPRVPLDARRCAGGRLVDGGRRICGEHRRRAGRWLGAVPSRGRGAAAERRRHVRRDRGRPREPLRVVGPDRHAVLDRGRSRATTTSARCCWS
jgi:hypothetical protein